MCVDFGGNIGVTTVYFLNNADCVVYTYEPSPYNIDKLRAHTEKYGDRCVINPVAVSVTQGSASFGVEQTGRYGGIGVATGREITVPTVSANEELAAIIAKFGLIDVLKIDIENMELEILKSIDDDNLQKIRYIHVEFLGELPFRKEYFSRTKRGTIYTYKNTSL